MLVLSALHLDVCGKNTCGVELCLRLGDIGPRRSPAFESILSQPQRPAVSLDGVVQQLFLCIGAAHFEVVNRKLGVQAQAGSFKVRVTGLRLFSSRRYAAADPSP